MRVVSVAVSLGPAGIKPTEAKWIAVSLGPAGIKPNGVELRCLSHFFMAPS